MTTTTNTPKIAITRVCQRSRPSESNSQNGGLKCAVHLHVPSPRHFPLPLQTTCSPLTRVRLREQERHSHDGVGKTKLSSFASKAPVFGKFCMAEAPSSIWPWSSNSIRP
eukprot:1808119-Pleurochrysis_carterae.AAC.2